MIRLSGKVVNRMDVVVHNGESPAIHLGDKNLRLDGWQNLLTGMGIENRDKNVSTQFARTMFLDENTLTFMYREDGLARRIIDLPVNEMVREWFTVEGDSDGEILQKLKSLHAKERIRSGLKWASLYGGSLGVIGIDDGGDLEQPLNQNNIRDIHFIHIFDRWRVKWSTLDQYNDPEHPKFGEPEFYNISPIHAISAPFRVHETRTIRFDGAEIPLRVRHGNSGWYDSDLQRLYNRIRSMGNIYGGVENIVNEFVISTLQIDNLQDMIANGKEDLIKKRLNLIDLSKHIINTVLLDKEEKFEKKASTVTGLSKLMQDFVLALSAESGIPVTVLMGQSPKGLQATGESDIRIWYDNIAAMQEEKILSQLEYLVWLCQLSKNGAFKGKEIENWSINFNPLWQPTQKEIAETRLNTAKTDEIYVNTGVVQPSEVALSRFGGDTYSMDTVIDTDLREAEPMILEPEEEKEEEEEEEEGEEE